MKKKDNAIERRKEVYARFEPMLEGGNCQVNNLGENMKVVCQSIGGWWKPVALLDCNDKTGTLIIDLNDMTLQNVEEKDIDWPSLRGLDDACINRAKSRNAFYPTNIRGFHNGTAEMEWQLRPDGRYYMDDDGYGMEDEDEVTLLGRIDRTGRVIRRFRLCH